MSEMMAGPAPLMKKLRLEPEKQALLLNPPESFGEALGADVSKINFLADFEENLEFVLVFAHKQRQITSVIPDIHKSLIEDGLLWLAYPKKSSKVESDLSRDVIWDMLKDYGYRPVTQISIDDIWSALRFRQAHLVGK